MRKPPLAPPLISGPKAPVAQAPKVFDPTVQARMRVSPPPVYKPAEHIMQSKPASSLAAVAPGKQSATWPPVYRPVSSGIQNKTSLADLKLGAPKSHKPPTGVASKAAGTNLIGPPIYRPSIQPKVPHTSQSRVSPASPSISRHSVGTGAALHVTPDFRVVQPSKGTKLGAEKASTRRIKVDGDAPTGTVALDTENVNAITTPDGDPNVTNTTDDGEVALLISALGQFFHSLDSIGRKTKRLKSHTFLLEIEGSWGPCDGCKKRLARFGALWRDKARSVLQEGETATLTITFSYENPAQEFKKTGGWSTVYGWYSDGERGPCTHTLTFNAQG